MLMECCALLSYCFALWFFFPELYGEKGLNSERKGKTGKVTREKVLRQGGKECKRVRDGEEKRKGAEREGERGRMCLSIFTIQLSQSTMAESEWMDEGEMREIKGMGKSAFSHCSDRGCPLACWWTPMNGPMDSPYSNIYEAPTDKWQFLSRETRRVYILCTWLKELAR